MPVETPPPIVQAYALSLLLAGVACFIHFFFFSKRSLRIEPEKEIPGWQLSFPDFFLGLFALVLTVLLIQTVLAGLVSIEAATDMAASHIILFGFAMHLAVLGALYTFYRKVPEKFETPLDRTNLSWPAALKISLYSFLVVIPIIYPLTYAWQFALESIGLEGAQQETVLVFSQIEQMPVLLLMIALTVLLAPLSEELIFRGCLYRFLKAKTSIIFGLTVSGALFGLLHQNLLSFLPLFLLGVALAYAYEKSGSIKVPILIHSIFNLNTVIIILLTMNRA